MDCMHGCQLEGANWSIGIEEMDLSRATVLHYSSGHHSHRSILISNYGI